MLGQCIIYSCGESEVTDVAHRPGKQCMCSVHCTPPSESELTLSRPMHGLPKCRLPTYLGRYLCFALSLPQPFMHQTPWMRLDATMSAARQVAECCIIPQVPPVCTEYQASAYLLPDASVPCCAKLISSDGHPRISSQQDINAVSLYYAKASYDCCGARW